MYSVNLKTSQNYEDGFELTNALLPNSFKRVDKLVEISIVNTSRREISVTDAYGVTTSHPPVRINDSFYNFLSATPSTNSVYIVERRPMGQDDLITSITLDNERRTSKHKLYNTVMKGLCNVDSKKQLKDYYLIHSISEDELLEHKSLFIGSHRLNIAIKGYEACDTSLVSKEFRDISNTPINNSLYSTITYYSKDPNAYIYINTLGKATRIDSTITTAPNIAESVSIITDEMNTPIERIIKAKDFAKNGIYRSRAEASNIMSKESIIQERKLDLELQTVETKIMSNVMNEYGVLFKWKSDLLKSRLVSTMELDKVRKLKEKENQRCGYIDGAKKYFDFISMIVKLVI